MRECTTHSSAPLVTVVIPAYNREKFLPETIESVRTQTFQDWELIIVDDGSTDDTATIVSQLSKTDHRIRYIWQQNSERAVARNRGIKESRGAYIAFLDSDDLWLPNKLEKQVNTIMRDGASCCY